MSNSDESNKDYLSVVEVAKIFGKSDMTIRRWIGKGLFPNYKRTGPFSNSPRLIPRSDIQALQEEISTKK